MVADVPNLAATLGALVEGEPPRDLLRLITAGSVDDGKSTLMGRLLYDSRGIYEDQLQAVTKASVGRGAGQIDFSLLTDGLRAEREQGITIDVAYRYFATAKRKFIIADTPGHEQYTRNMVTGASTAELAIVLVDARKGLLVQSRRHLTIAGLLGLPHVVVAVNKMDLVGYDQQIFDRIEADFRRFLSTSSTTPCFIPVSALHGDNVVTQSEKMPWYHGRSLLQYLEQVPVNQRAEHAAFRFPVQRVVRPDADFRGYAGTIASGSIRPGDTLTAYPSGKTSKVTALYTFGGNLNKASVGDAVTISLSDDLDISRGDLLAQADRPPLITNHVQATVVWLSEIPAEVGKRYLIKHTTRLDTVQIRRINSELHLESLRQHPTQTLEMNAIGMVEIESARPLVFDLYGVNRTTGSFILIDPTTNATVAAGMIAGAANECVANPKVTMSDRVSRQRHTGAIIHLPNRQGLVEVLERQLFDRGCTVFALEEAKIEVLEALLNLGVIVLTTNRTTEKCTIKTKDGPTTVLERQLDRDDAKASETLQNLLRREQILFAR